MSNREENVRYYDTYRAVRLSHSMSVDIHLFGELPVVEDALPNPILVWDQDDVPGTDVSMYDA